VGEGLANEHYDGFSLAWIPYSVLAWYLTHSVICKDVQLL